MRRYRKHTKSLIENVNKTRKKRYVVQNTRAWHLKFLI